MQLNAIAFKLNFVVQKIRINSFTKLTSMIVLNSLKKVPQLFVRLGSTLIMTLIFVQSIGHLAYNYHCKIINFKPQKKKKKTCLQFGKHI